MASSIYCFAGPSLGADAIRRILPTATVLPPAAHGDLLRLGLDATDTVLIIDGCYLDRAPMRHREILWALESGVTIIGAAGIGALRAVELEQFGMQGHGKVFRLFRRGLIRGDDEVMMLHASQAKGFLPESEALVNIRATCHKAIRNGVLTRHEAALIIDAASSRSFWQRQYPIILNTAVAHGLPETTKARLIEQLPIVSRNVLQEDAISLVNTVAEKRPLADNNRATSWPLPTADIYKWREDTLMLPHSDTMISEATTLAAAQVLALDYPRLHYSVALECLAVDGLAQEGIENDLALSLLAADCGLTDQELPEWMENRSLRFDEISVYYQRRALVHSLLDSTAAPNISELEELAVRNARRRGIFPQHGAPPNQSDWLTEEERDEFTETAKLARMLTRAFRLGRNVAMRSPFITALKLYGDLRGAAARASAAAALNREHAHRRPDLELSALSPDVVLDWFGRYWRQSDHVLLAAADRGLFSRSVAVTTLQQNFLYARTYADASPWTCFLEAGPRWLSVGSYAQPQP